MVRTVSNRCWVCRIGDRLTRYALVFIGCVALPLQALEVVATTASMGVLARSVAGDGVKVTVLAPPDRDPHHLQARPGMLAALRRADLLVAVGAELEIGWLPAAIQGAANRRIQPGSNGYFEAAAHIALIDVGGVADRALGDLHPAGNPHLHLDAERMVQVAAALAERLALLNPTAREAYLQRAAAIAAAVERQLPLWRAAVAGHPGVLLYHKDGNYLMLSLGVPIHGYIELLPGVPPTMRQLHTLVERLQGQRGVVVMTNYQPEKGARFVADRVGWSLQRLMMEPPIDGDLNAWLALITTWVDAVANHR
jgi:zinc/manganese transport system substrate-binding protein